MASQSEQLHYMLRPEASERFFAWPVRSTASATLGIRSGILKDMW